VREAGSSFAALFRWHRLDLSWQVKKWNGLAAERRLCSLGEIRSETLSSRPSGPTPVPKEDVTTALALSSESMASMFARPIPADCGIFWIELTTFA
jgi:hypothetical protein